MCGIIIFCCSVILSFATKKTKKTDINFLSSLLCILHSKNGKEGRNKFYTITQIWAFKCKLFKTLTVEYNLDIYIRCISLKIKLLKESYNDKCCSNCIGSNFLVIC